MQLISWSKELEIGIDQIDRQHKQLVNLINELNIAIGYTQPNSVMLPIVMRLQNYAETHFAAEEEIFSTYDYPDRAAHEADHAAFSDSITYIRKQCELIDAPMSTRIRDFLLGWLCNHIKNKDMDYKRFLETIQKEKATRQK
jgi:methyl-accepting chemotaxis protein/hemerythrin